MEFAPQQDAALQRVRTWLQRGEPQVFRLFGYAGTGKTTLARHLVEGVEGPTYAAAYTGKAAYVLSQKGLPATTLHRLIYLPKNRSRARLLELREKLLGLPMDDPARLPLVQEVSKEEENTARPFFALNLDSPLKHARLLVVDEVSMVDKTMGADILSFGCQVLVLGDPAQLPPVYGEGYFTEAEPDVMLTEIHRQARDNPIIHLASLLRERRLPRYGQYGTSLVTQRMDASMALEADQLIVGKNDTKFKFNQRVRELKGRAPGKPVPGDKLVCLRNNYEHEVHLLNGALWTVHSLGEDFGDRMQLKLLPEMGDMEKPLEVVAHAHYFLGDKPPFWTLKDAEEFDYGYALTCHKSQGSQWNRVLVYDQSLTFGANRWRWLYTAVTRAAERVDLISS